jgi:hypothetical protein
MHRISPKPKALSQSNGPPRHARRSKAPLSRSDPEPNALSLPNGPVERVQSSISAKGRICLRHDLARPAHPQSPIPRPRSREIQANPRKSREIQPKSLSRPPQFKPIPLLERDHLRRRTALSNGPSRPRSPFPSPFIILRSSFINRFPSSPLQSSIFDHQPSEARQPAHLSAA